MQQVTINVSEVLGSVDKGFINSFARELSNFYNKNGPFLIGTEEELGEFFVREGIDDITANVLNNLGDPLYHKYGLILDQQHIDTSFYIIQVEYKDGLNNDFHKNLRSKKKFKL